MTSEKILSDWRKNIYAPVYWLEGEEPYFIDQLVHYAENNILSESEVEFNLSIVYGKDVDVVTLLSLCKKYPMFGERQLVIVKEAQQMRQIELLEKYFAHPQPTTILIIAYKDKKVDARSKFGKFVKGNTAFFSTKKIYENELPGWTKGLLDQKGMRIDQKALMLLIDHIGNDLSRIDNEVRKLSINLKDQSNITQEDIEKYVGISKDFNGFEFQKAIAYKDFSKAIRIIQYFQANPKAASIQMILPNLYSFFSKLAIAHSLQSTNERSIASGLGINPYFVKDYMQALRHYSYSKTEYILLYLHEYNLRSIGINDVGTSDAELLKELAVKVMN